ncbi:long-chain fatty acid--CoA ligase, partial [Mycobacterium sp. ITM-2017-0098]
LSQAMLARIESDLGAEGGQGWGMTETSPICVVGRLLPKHASLWTEDQQKIKLNQGRGVCGVELKIVDESGARLPWDGKAFGEVFV